MRNKVAKRLKRIVKKVSLSEEAKYRQTKKGQIFLDNGERKTYKILKSVYKKFKAQGVSSDKIFNTLGEVNEGN